MKLEILLPVDNSTFCQAATRIGYQLAAALPGSRLNVLNVVNVRPSSGNVLNDLPGYVGFEPAVVSNEVYKAKFDAARAMIDQVVEHARDQGIDAHGFVATGAVTDELVAAALNNDVVIMGLQGESEDRHPGQGGAQASNAMPRIDVPVLLVPREVTAIDSFAVGYDGSPSAERALEMVGKLAVPMGATVHLIHVGDAHAGQAKLEAAKAKLGEGVQTVFHLAQGTEIHKVLVETATAAGAHVLVLGFQGQSKLKDVVFGSAQTHLLNKDLRVALLIAH